MTTFRPPAIRPEIVRHIGSWVCLCGKEHEWDSADVFREGHYSSRPEAGWMSCRVCECERQWNVHARTYLKEGGIIETRVYVRLSKDLELGPKPKKARA